MTGASDKRTGVAAKKKHPASWTRQDVFMWDIHFDAVPALRHRVIVDDDTDVGIITAGPIV